MRLAAPPTHPCRHYNAICIHTLQNSKGEPIRPPKRPQPHPPHTGGTFHRRLQPLDTEKHKVSCSGFLPKTHPMQHECGHYNAFCSTTYIHADITMRFASTRCRTPREIRFDPENPRNDRRRTCRTAEENPHCRLQPLCTEKHNVSCSGFLPKTKPMQQSCSYYNAFGSTTYTSMQPLQCDLHPHVAKHQGRTDSTPKQPQPHPPHRGETFHRRLQPLDTEKHKVSCSGFLPKTHPMQHECGQYNAVCIIACLTRMSQQTWQQNMTAITQPTSQVSTSLRHHFPRHHFPRSPLPFVTTSLGTSFLGRHFPWSPLP